MTDCGSLASSEIGPLVENVPFHMTSPVFHDREGAWHATSLSPEPLPCTQQSPMFADFLAEQGWGELPGFFLGHCGMDDCVASRVGTAHLVRTFLELGQMH